MPLDCDAAVLVSEVGRLRHVAEEPDLDDAGEHLDARQELNVVIDQHQRGFDAGEAAVPCTDPS